MSTCDEKLDSASDHLRQAAKDLSEIVVDGCWGADELKDSYLETVQQVMDETLKLRRLLKRA